MRKITFIIYTKDDTGAADYHIIECEPKVDAIIHTLSAFQSEVTDPDIDVQVEMED